MILDDRAELADNLAANTGATGTSNLGDTIDTQAGGITRTPDGTFSADLYLVVRVAQAFTSGGAATVAFRLVSDETGTPSTTTATVHATSGALPLASLTAGATIFCINCRELQRVERFLGVQQVTGVAALTGGALDVFFTDSPALSRNYADNVR